jgi:hypothetical protein
MYVFRASIASRDIETAERVQRNRKDIASRRDPRDWRLLIGREEHGSLQLSEGHEHGCGWSIALTEGAQEGERLQASLGGRVGEMPMGWKARAREAVRGGLIGTRRAMVGKRAVAAVRNERPAPLTF